MKAGGTSGEIKEAHQDREREREREKRLELGLVFLGSSSVASTGNSLERFGLAPSIPPGHRLCAGVEGWRVW